MRGLHLLLCAWLCASLAAHAQPPSPPLGSSERLLSRGDAALAAGDSISAVSFYRDAIVRAPRDPRGYAALGQAYLTLGEPKNAREVFEAGMRSTRGSEALAVGFARSQAALGQPEQALATLRRAAAEGQRSQALSRALAEQAEQSGAFVEALAAWRALLQQLSASPGESAERLAEARTHVAALSLLVGGANRLSPAHCSERRGSLVLEALLGCPPDGPAARNSLH